MNYDEYTVEFRILSSSLDPHRITRELGLVPCQIRIDGEVGLGRRLQRGMWAYNGGEGSRTWRHLADGLSDVMSKLWPYRELIAEYAKEGELIWWCGHFHYSFDGGPRLSAPFLKKLGDFGADLFIDTYSSEDSSDDSVV